MSDERNNGLFGGNEPIDLGSDANFTDLPDFSSDDFDSIFGTAEKKDDAQTESAEVKTESSPLTKKAVETAMNNLIKVRVAVDTLSKKEIKEQLTVIIEELGVISK